MAATHFEGIVTSVASPSEANGERQYAFSLNSDSIPNPAQDVFNISLKNPFAEQVMHIVVTAFELGLPLQVMVFPGNNERSVDWVQIPRPRRSP